MSPEQHKEYAQHLEYLVSPDRDVVFWDDADWGVVFLLAHATAAQRSEALLRTINKWDDSK